MSKSFILPNQTYFEGLRLGNCILQDVPGEKPRTAWIVYLKSDRWALNKANSTLEEHYIVGTVSSLEEAHNRLINNDAPDYIFTGAPDDYSLTQYEESTDAAGTDSKRVFTHVPKLDLRLQLPDDRDFVGDFAPSALRMFLPHLRPGHNVHVLDDQLQTAAQKSVAAVGIGLGGPVGIAFHGSAKKFEDASDIVLGMTLPHSTRQMLRVDRLRRAEVVPHA